MNLIGQALANAAGIITVTLGPVDGAAIWLISRIVISSNSALATTAKVYIDSIAPENIVDYSANGNIDVADQSSPIELPPGATLIIVWTGATPTTSTGYARIQYQRVATPVAGEEIKAEALPPAVDAFPDKIAAWAER